ncbi:nucleoside hydrolase [Granulicella cerasi]|uniref:Nucleoside hydrolase n=1 Tax=Granulicella cerasi TaxID=741063 RepID=A0ABW1ZES1_9BACT|nr:nucleoside hydrolase [Granulicella cerasi]
MKLSLRWLAPFLLFCGAARTQSMPAAPQQVIVDTDIGDDLDDAYALGLLLQSPSIQLLGVTADWGDTKLRARMLDRFLAETGHAEIPVFIGPEKTSLGMASFTQRAWAERGPSRPHGDAIGFIIDTAKQHPGEVTLIALGPMTNLAAALKRDPESFHKLRRIVMMGGSVRRGYGEPSFLPPVNRPSAEYNIKMDIASAQAVFKSGVPIAMMPLDSTQIMMDETKRSLIFAAGTPLTDVLASLTAEWFANQYWPVPTAFDAVAALYAIDPASCPVTPLRIEVNADGFTREVAGKPNADVCLSNDPDRFFQSALPLWLREIPAKR